VQQSIAQPAGCVVRERKRRLCNSRRVGAVHTGAAAVHTGAPAVHTGSSAVHTSDARTSETGTAVGGAVHTGASAVHTQTSKIGTPRPRRRNIASCPAAIPAAAGAGVAGGCCRLEELQEGGEGALCKGGGGGGTVGGAEQLGGHDQELLRSRVCGAREETSQDSARLSCRAMCKGTATLNRFLMLGSVVVGAH